MGTSHHWNLKAQKRRQGEGCPQAWVPQARPAHLVAPHRMGMKLKMLGIPGQ